ncbi:MAG: peptide chain release factor N(5)-glutamine methyltransferase [Chloroflexi bacterium]|nr:peptide chain release factor N(5)-glutamine methyltransferase [Chloroflexota bacterium]
MENKLDQLAARLKPISETPNLDAQALLAHVTGKPRTWVLAHPETALTPKQDSALEAALVQLEGGVPLPYVLGHWEFFGLDFIVTPDVLIPRPETELLVEHAIQWLRDSWKRRTATSPLAELWAADVGTGSGCIAVTLAVQIPDLHLLATDISCPALEIARQNAAKHGVLERIQFAQGDLLDSAMQRKDSTILKFDLIAANLPYIPTETLHGLDVYGREPEQALDGGVDGLDLVRRLLHDAPRWLAPGGLILLEIEASQGQAALSLAYDAFTQANIKLFQDLAGRDRLIAVQI